MQIIYTNKIAFSYEEHTLTSVFRVSKLVFTDLCVYKTIFIGFNRVAPPKGDVPPEGEPQLRVLLLVPSTFTDDSEVSSNR